MEHNEFRDAGYRVFGLYGANKKGKCLCKHVDCDAPYKHPLAKSWQHTPVWSDEQWEVGQEVGQFKTGYGVLCRGLLVVDVDARNGGIESYEKLVDIVSCAGLIVETGSGGGSKHLYFKIPEDLSLYQHLSDYPGIDFISSGYAVGPGSKHISGNDYKIVAGSVLDIDDAPAELIELLTISFKRRTVVDGLSIDVSNDDIVSMLSCIDGNVDYDTYVKIGMAIHDATGGAGFDMWDTWASKNKSYTGKFIYNRWNSFGKSSNPVTLGTLIHLAELGGWEQPVTFVSDVEFTDLSKPKKNNDVDIDVTGIDLLRPPGFVGELTEWINSQSFYPRENLAVSSALIVMSCVSGMRYIDDLDGVTANLFCFGVAGSGTGKESILKSTMALLKSAGVSAAIYGDIKSEQEIFRNLTRHQACYYLIDEMGEKLAKISNAVKRGGATYLEGVIGALMSIYSKADSFALVTGDLKEEIRKLLQQELSVLQKRIDENEDSEGKAKARIENVIKTLQTLDLGIESPYLSLFGITTPDKFESLIDFDMSVNGFLGRALIFREANDNPKRKIRKNINRQVPFSIAQTLSMMYAPGYSSPPWRVEKIGERCKILTLPEAHDMLDVVSETFWRAAEEHSGATGLTAIPRRGYEHVAKISTVLAIPSGIRTVEHVRWSYALVKRDIDLKIRLAHANTADEQVDALASRIIGVLSVDHGLTLRMINRKCRGVKADHIKRVVAALIKAEQIKQIDESSEQSGRPTVKYLLNTL